MNPSQCIQSKARAILDKKYGYYCLIAVDMGCMWFVRNIQNDLEYFFMHSDDWGQYGDMSKKNELDVFLKGLTKILEC